MSPSRLRVYFNEFLEHCAKPEQRTNELTPEAKRAIVEEIHADVFAYPHWQEVLGQCGLHPLDGSVGLDPDAGEAARPVRGGWSNEGESEEHRMLKEFIVRNPRRVGLPRDTPRCYSARRFDANRCANRLKSLDPEGQISAPNNTERIGSEPPTCESTSPPEGSR